MFLGIFTFQIAIGAAVVLVPGNLITLILNTQVLEGVITPMTLIMILVLANRWSLLGSAANGPLARWLGGASILSVAAVASVFVVLTVLGWFGLNSAAAVLFYGAASSRVVLVAINTTLCAGSALSGSAHGRRPTRDRE